MIHESTQSPLSDSILLVSKAAVQSLRFWKINKELSLFGSNHLENIQRLTASCGELLGATCVIYNRLERGMICSLASWMTPSEYNPADKPDGHICYDVIRDASDQVFVIRNLQESRYAETDLNVRRFNLQTYIGKSVRVCGVRLGSLCAVYQADFNPGDVEKSIIGILASLVGIEEDRRLEEEKRSCAESRYEALINNHSDPFCRWTDHMVLTHTNRTFNELFCTGNTSLIGRYWLDLMPGEERPAAESLFSEIMENPRPAEFEHSFIRQDGVTGRIRWTCIPLFNADNSLKEFQAIGKIIP